MRNAKIKTLIYKIVSEETKKISMGGAYRWKEELMQAVQKAIKDRAGGIDSQEKYQAVIDEEIEKLRGDIETTLEMIARALYQVPFEAFRKK